MGYLSGGIGNVGKGSPLMSHHMASMDLLCPCDCCFCDGIIIIGIYRYVVVVCSRTLKVVIKRNGTIR